MRRACVRAAGLGLGIGLGIVLGLAALLVMFDWLDWYEARSTLVRLRTGESFGCYTLWVRDDGLLCGVARKDGGYLYRSAPSREIDEIRVTR